MRECVPTQPAAKNCPVEKDGAVGIFSLLGAEDAVARVAEAGHNVAVLVQMIVHRAAVDVDVGMLLAEHPDALGRSHLSLIHI